MAIIKIFDLHCDTLGRCFDEKAGLFENNFHLSLSRAAKYTGLCQVFAVWIDDIYKGAEASARFESILDYSETEFAKNAGYITLCKSPEDITRAEADGKYAAVLAMENGSAFAGDEENIYRYFQRGLRLVTITWNAENELGYGNAAENRGLKEFGKRAVSIFSELGIVPDVSHLSDAGFYDLAECYSGAFIASHSNSRTITDHPRNLTDEQFKEILRRGGLVGLNFCNLFLSGQSSADFEDIYTHLDYFLSLGGEDVLALGGDLDGADMPAGFTGIESYESLYKYLTARNIPESILEKVFYKNAKRAVERQLTINNEQ